MRQMKARGKGWVSILLVLFLCAAAFMPEGIGSAQAAYSPTSSSNEQAGQQAPGNSSRGPGRGTASHGGMTPAQSADFWQEGECIQHFPDQEPRQPSLNTTACHEVFTLLYRRPLSELASRTGGHAPP